MYCDDILLKRSPVQCLKYILIRPKLTKYLMNFLAKILNNTIELLETDSQKEKLLFINNLTKELNIENYKTFIAKCHQLYTAEIGIYMAIILNYGSMQLKSIFSPYTQIKHYLASANPFYFKKPKIDIERPKQT